MNFYNPYMPTTQYQSSMQQYYPQQSTPSLPAQLQLQLSGLATMEQGIGDKVQSCCCETNRNIDSVKHENAMNTAAINANTTAQTQKILDAIAGNRMADMQNQINQLQLQAATCNVMRFPNQWTYAGGYFLRHHRRQLQAADRTDQQLRAPERSGALLI